MNRPSRSRSRRRMPSRSRSRSSSRAPATPAQVISLDLSSASAEAIRILSSVVTNPKLIFLALVSLYIIMDSGPLYNTGIVGNFINTRNDSVSTWIKKYPNDFTGWLILLPGAAVASTNLMAIYPIAAFLWVSVIPESMIYEYFFQSLAMILIFKAESSNLRKLILIGVGVAYVAGWVVFGNSSTISGIPFAPGSPLSWNQYKRDVGTGVPPSAPPDVTPPPTIKFPAKV